MNNLFEISSEERNRILNLHESATKRQYLTLEQSSQPQYHSTTTSKPINTTFPVQNVGDNFAYGQVDSPNVKSKIISLKPQIDKFIKDDGGKNFLITITAGESKVTNPKGFEEKGSLALARANSVKGYFEEVFQDLIKNGVLNIKVPTDVSQVSLGKTLYDKTKGDINNPDKKKLYNDEQFVRFTITGSGSKCNFNFDNKAGQGVPNLDYVTTDEILEGKGEATFTPGQIPDRLVIMDSQGKIETDTGYITGDVSKYPDWKYTPLYVYLLTLVSQTNPVAVSGSEILTITVTDYADLVKQLLNDPNSRRYEKMGSEIEPGLKAMAGMIKKGRTEFVIYKLSNAGTTVQFDSPNNDKKIKVYSPIGTDKIKTGYGLVGRCIN